MHTATPTLSFQVTSMERVTEHGSYSLVFGRQVSTDRAGFDARVTVYADGGEIGTQHFDRIEGEDAWHCSASFRQGCSMPTFMHGLFSRCTIPKVANAELSALLDAKAGGAA